MTKLTVPPLMTDEEIDEQYADYRGSVRKANNMATRVAINTRNSMAPYHSALCVAVEELEKKCMCWPANDIRVSRNPCCVCLTLTSISKILAQMNGDKL